MIVQLGTSAVPYFTLHRCLSDFVRRGGRMRLICSPALNLPDYEAMQKGMTEVRSRELIGAHLDDLLAKPEAVPATKLLATLVALGHIQVRVAFTENPSRGIFHDKLGVFRDADGKAVSFIGSANETWAAWLVNHESFDVFCSWRGEEHLMRTRVHFEDFERLWNESETGVYLVELDQVTKDAYNFDQRTRCCRCGSGGATWRRGSCLHSPTSAASDFGP